MEMFYVDSSNIDQIGFDERENELHIIFKKGGDHYVYSDVSGDIWEQFLNASSKGYFLQQELKSKGYAYRKL